MATETWVLNETLTISGSNVYNNIEMTYSGQQRAYPIKSLKIYEYIDGRETAYSVLGQEQSVYSDENTSYELYGTGGGASGWFSYNGTLCNTWKFSQPVTDSTLLTWLQANGTKQETPSTNRTYDLSTNSKWASLPYGQHTVKIRAVGDGFGDSSFSNGVSVTKVNTGETWLLNESINGAVRIYYGPQDFVEDFGSAVVNGSGEYWSVDFTSYDQNYIAIGYDWSSPAQPGAEGVATLVYSVVETTGAQPSTWWVDDAYRTITFAQPVTNSTLLAWLQENGTKQGATLINFTIDGTAYQAEEGMTWAQWVASSYNTGGYIIYENSLVSTPNGAAGGSRVTTDSAHNNPVGPSDAITATTYYYGAAN